MIGKTLISAEKDLNKIIYRIVRIDDRPLMITCDFKPDRLNLELETKDGIQIITNIWNG